MKKFKQILAIIGIVALVGLYLTAFILAIFGNENSTKLFNASIYATIVIPIFIWIMIWVADLIKKLK